MNSHRHVLTALVAFLMLGTIDLHAQELREMQPLEADDFECLQSLDCIQNSQSLKSKGWSFIFDETVDAFANERTAYMKGENIYFFAMYDKKGNLIRSTYRRKDVALPRCLHRYHAETADEGSRIAGSEMTMKDFDPSTIKYKVMLESGTSSRSEVYDSDFISDVHREYEGVAELCMI
ncbi:hypothetical protein [Rhodohalobacter mucosus]|uniref:Uncharacterized protein n=1 Tax=Rhodohalobacter mucosus TaxID=2079485 RepID=A0A316TPH4_9BACT|nr:hypothetical protein [Rhodohalobacter mucosus]PWN06513.1 hypothetical protein DDZ15_08300 [Rhodohalobacter mucosus]